MSAPPRLLTRFGDHFYALDKPSGMVVYSAGTDAPDLLAWLAAAPGFPRDLRPAHRLDRGTSGVLLCATRKGRKVATSWFEERRVTKTYLALVHGRCRDHGTVRIPLDDGRRGRPLPAETAYRSLEKFSGSSLLEVSPTTGRKHQIRRHLAEIGHPVVGDTRYRGRRSGAVEGAPERLWLHARRLEVPDPRDADARRVIESPVPDELRVHLAFLRQVNE